MKKITLLLALLMWSSNFYAQTYLTEDFEGLNPALTYTDWSTIGWTEVNSGGIVTNYPWRTSAHSSNNEMKVTGYSGSQSAFYNQLFNLSDGEIPVSSKERWLISPAMNLTSATNPKLTYFETTLFADFAATTHVKYSTDYVGSGDPALATWSTIDLNTTLDDFTTAEDGVWKLKGSFDLTAAAGNASVYIAFQYVAASELSEWYIDDVLVRETPSCVEPSLGNFTGITTDQATFNWSSHPDGSETSWDVELVDISASGTPTGTPTAYGVTNSHTFMSLAAGNNYQAYVRADCDNAPDGDDSSWSGPFAFSTLSAYDSCGAGAISVTHESNVNLPGSATATAGSVDGATGDSVITCAGGTPNNDVWFSFEATSVFATVRVESTSGTFDAVLEVLDGCGGTQIGCIDGTGYAGTEQVNVSLTQGLTYYVRVYDYYNSTPDDGTFTLKVYRDVPLETEELEKNEFTFYPNPVQDKLNLRAQKNIENISIYNMLGQEVMRKAPNARSSEVDMSALRTGAYFVKVTINGITETKRIIKR